MTTLDLEPLTVSVPLREDPPGVFRVGNSRVLLELVIRAFQRGQTLESIVQSYDTLSLADVYAVVSYYLANPTPFDEYLRRCDQEAKAVQDKLEAAGMTNQVTAEELLARARAKGLLRDQAAK
jgi:uncharacterized protein (DUF433 family)